MHNYCVEMLLMLLLEGKNQQSFHCSTFLGYDTLYIISWKAHNATRLWPQQFQLRGVTVSATAVKILKM